MENTVINNPLIRLYFRGGWCHWGVGPLEALDFPRYQEKTAGFS